MANEHGQHGGGSKKDRLEVTVTFISAKKPFEDKHVERTKTLLSLKADVMKEFKVQESQNGNEQVFFWLYQGDVKLEDQIRTLGDLAQGADTLTLRLVQQIIYG